MLKYCSVSRKGAKGQKHVQAFCLSSGIPIVSVQYILNILTSISHVVAKVGVEIPTRAIITGRAEILKPMFLLRKMSGGTVPSWIFIDNSYAWEEAGMQNK